jgi:hypothetical protein
LSPDVHALEQLRYVARAWEVGDEFPAAEVAAVLAELAEQSPATLLQACRRMIEYFPASGRVWWLSARALSAADPVEGIWMAAEELDQDPTGRHLATSLPPSAGVAVVGPAPFLAKALRRRSDLVLHSKAKAAAILVVPARAAGPDALLLTERANLAVAAARRARKPVWVAVEEGVLLPGPLWDQLLARAGDLVGAVVVPAGDFGPAVGPGGQSPLPVLLSAPTCPPVAELLGWKS